MWSEETAVLAREHNDANVVSVGGRMHTLEDMIRFVEVFLDDRLHRRGAAHPPDRGCSPDYEKTGNLPALPESALGRRPGQPEMPEGHTLFRLARTISDHFAGRVVARQQPAGPVRGVGRADRRHAAGDGAESYGKHLFVDFESDRQVHVHLGLYGKFAVHDGEARPPAARSGCGWSPAAATGARRRTATCAAPPPAS